MSRTRGGEKCSHTDQFVTFAVNKQALTLPKESLKRVLFINTKINKKDWGLWQPWWSNHTWLGRTLIFVQISNGHAGPLSPGLQLGR